MGATAYKSTQYTNYTATPQVAVVSRDWGGTKRVYWFDYTPTVALGFTNADYVELLVMPKNSRFMGGWIVHNDADCEIDMGTSASAALYGNNLAADADAPKQFGNTIALGFGTILTADTVLRATAATADMAIGSTFYGYVELLQGY